MAPIQSNILSAFIVAARRAIPVPLESDFTRVWEMLQVTRINRNRFFRGTGRPYILALQRSRYYGTLGRQHRLALRKDWPRLTP